MEELDTAQWYVLQVMSGQENRVCKSLRYRAAAEEAEGKTPVILAVEIPTERVEDRKNGVKVIRDRKLYPGYVLIRLRLFDADGELSPETWGVIRETNGIIGFIGGDHPVPLSESEVQEMLRQGETANAAPKPVVEFSLGETVIIRDGGAFENIEGSVVKIDRLRQILSVSVNMFGSSTIVETGFGQVERSK